MNTPPPHHPPHHQDLTLTIQPTTTSRRLPPPCWSHDETVALIDSYRDKWYSLRRGNLRAPHWQQVADGVSLKCPPFNNLPKTSIQCRHKMEKLRKRYRAEIQRIRANANENADNVRRFMSSTWVHFKLMDCMELGVEIEDDLMLYPKGIKEAIPLPLNVQYPTPTPIGNGSNGSNGVRIKIPNSGNVLFDDCIRYTGMGKGNMKKRKVVEIDDDDDEEKDKDVMDEMVAAINKLGDGFVRMERMKMDMAREIESMRMKMEMKRTEMILELHQKLLDLFSNAVVGNSEKMKRMPTPET